MYRAKYNYGVQVLKNLIKETPIFDIFNSVSDLVYLREKDNDAHKSNELQNVLSFLLSLGLFKSYSNIFGNNYLCSPKHFRYDKIDNNKIYKDIVEAIISFNMLKDDIENISGKNKSIIFETLNNNIDMKINADYFINVKDFSKLFNYNLEIDPLHTSIEYFKDKFEESKILRINSLERDKEYNLSKSSKYKTNNNKYGREVVNIENQIEVHKNSSLEGELNKYKKDTIQIEILDKDNNIIYKSEIDYINRYKSSNTLIDIDSYINHLNYLSLLKAINIFTNKLNNIEECIMPINSENSDNYMVYRYSSNSFFKKIDKDLIRLAFKPKNLDYFNLINKNFDYIESNDHKKFKILKDCDFENIGDRLNPFKNYFSNIKHSQEFLVLIYDKEKADEINRKIDDEVKYVRSCIENEDVFSYDDEDISDYGDEVEVEIEIDYDLYDYRYDDSDGLGFSYIGVKEEKVLRDKTMAGFSLYKIICNNIKELLQIIFDELNININEEDFLRNYKDIFSIVEKTIDKDKLKDFNNGLNLFSKLGTYLLNTVEKRLKNNNINLTQSEILDVLINSEVEVFSLDGITGIFQGIEFKEFLKSLNKDALKLIKENRIEKEFYNFIADNDRYNLRKKILKIFNMEIIDIDCSEEEIINKLNISPDKNKDNSIFSELIE